MPQFRPILSSVIATGWLLIVASTSYAEDTYQFSNSPTDLTELIQLVAKATGKTIIIGPNVRGSFNVATTRAMTTDELYATFLSILDVHGYSAVESNGIVRILAETDAKNFAPGVDVASAEEDEEYVTQLVSINPEYSDEIITALKPLVSKFGMITAVNSVGMLVVTDRATNVERILTVLEELSDYQ